MNIDTLKQIVEKFPEDALSQFTLGNKYYENNELENAKTHLEKAYSLDSRHMLTHLVLGQLYATQDQTEKAREIFKHGLSIIPSLNSGEGQDLEPDIKMALAELDEEDDF